MTIYELVGLDCYYVKKQSKHTHNTYVYYTIHIWIKLSHRSGQIEYKCIPIRNYYNLSYLTNDINKSGLLSRLKHSWIGGEKKFAKYVSMMRKDMEANEYALIPPAAFSSDILSLKAAIEAAIKNRNKKQLAKEKSKLTAIANRNTAQGKRAIRIYHG